ncbi:hypothetical protein [Vibrio atlanticus]|uniref:hypothetical protein n=1 Tax=Vibrio atlanticus TaxID=693153 RepID=UPI0035540EBC
MRLNNLMESRAITKTVELWAVNEICEKWFFNESKDTNDFELVEKAVSDIIVSNQINVLLTFPNYTRLIIIETLNEYKQLSRENISYVEQQLHEARDDYQLDDMDFEVVLRAIKRH